MPNYNAVSMKSGLEGRNKHADPAMAWHGLRVSMKSGLEGRNNGIASLPEAGGWPSQ